MPASKTHANRSYDLVPGAHELADWVLVIRQGEPHRKNFECVTYAVQPVDDSPSGVLSFLLAKDNDDSEVYQVTLFRRGLVGCTCRAGMMRKWCKHVEALHDAAFVCGLPEPLAGKGVARG